MCCNYVAESYTTAYDIVPCGGHAALVGPPVEGEVRHEPRRVAEPRGTHSFDDIRRKERRCCEYDMIARILGIACTHSPFICNRADAVNRCAGDQTRSDSLRQPLRDPGIALRPG